MVQTLGANAELAKLDIRSAFRLMPISPKDYELLGIKHDGSYFYDKNLAFGAAISCATFEKFATFFRMVRKTKIHFQLCHSLPGRFPYGREGTYE